MIVVLFDRSEIIVTKAQGQKLQQSLSRSSEGFVTLNEIMVKKSAIAMVKPGGLSEADTVKADEKAKRLGTDSRTDQEKYKAARKAAASVREILANRKKPNEAK